MADRENVFYDAVRVFMNEWPVLKLAVQQGFGGIDSQEKGKWMIDVVIQVLTENNNVEDYELEDYMAEILYNEFDTISEDGSVALVAKKLCSLQKLWREGKLSDIQKEIRSIPRSQSMPVQASQMADEEEFDTEDQQQLNDTKMENIDVTERMGQMRLSQDSSEAESGPAVPVVGTPLESIDVDGATCDSRTQDDDGAEEGWEVVRRARRKR